jgi:vanillate/3-O-methylgallate O-demethylase
MSLNRCVGFQFTPGREDRGQRPKERAVPAPPSLQEGIDRAGSPVKLLWKPDAAPWKPPVLPPEFVGWREEQNAGYEGVALSNLCHHMRDLFIKGPDATRLLSDYSANNYENFEIGQAKQFVPVTERGHIVTDGIVMRDAADKYTLSGPPASQSWVLYHGEKGGYDVEFKDDPDSEFRQGDPVLFRYQVQGPRALDLVERVFGGPLPKTKFFHSTQVTLDGRSFRAFRHGMTGQPGYEFIGEYKDGDAVKDALLEAGQDLGIVQVGALAYATNGIESAWIPTPTPGIYTDPELRPYREWLKVFSYEGQKPLHGSFFCEDIEDYYTSPYELGYGRSIVFNHDFLGRDALERAKDEVARTKVTLVLDPEDVRAVFGADPGYYLSYARHRVEADSGLAGMTFYTGHIARLGTILSLALLDTDHATPGTEVTLVHGEHPGPGNDPDADFGFARLRATVQPAPYDEFARTQYRSDAALQTS